MGPKLGRLVATVGAFAVVGSIGIAGVPRKGGGASELLYLGTESGVTALDPDTGQSVFSARDAVAAGDWSLLVSAHAARSVVTSVNAIDPATGRVLAATSAPGKLRVRTVSFHGDRVALMPREYGGGLGRAEGRTSTRIVLTGFDGALTRTLDVQANIEPEAFSADGSTLFVLQYKPPLHPDRYQVRQLDLATGRLADIYTNDKDIQGDMQGIARTQALAPDGSRLYTLYTKGAHEAFVHVLDLGTKVANCVDLPKPFGRSPRAMALATSPNGEHLYVADTEHGRIADVDTASLKVTRAQRVRGLRLGGADPAVAASDSAVYVAGGGKVAALGTVAFHRFGTWRFDTSVRSLQLAGGEESELYVAERRHISVIDGRSGERMSRFQTPPGLGIRHVGYALPQTSIGSYQCAC